MIGLSRIIATGRAIVVRLVLLGLFAVVAPFGPWIVPVEATEIVEWRNVPISIVLNVGEERVLAFPDHVQVGVPPILRPASFRTQSTGGTVLWLARRPFDSQRLQVRLLSTGHVMLFDVTAVEGAGARSGVPASVLEPIQVSFPDVAWDLRAQVLNEGALAQSHALAPSRALALTPVVLTRFAAQQLYAPQRLLTDLPGIRRVPMGASDVIFLYRHDQVIASPLGSWQGGGFYVTAVKLSNVGSKRVLLDPRLLKGRFISATFQHNSLGPADSRSETTSVYLITDRPFIASILSANSGNED